MSCWSSFQTCLKQYTDFQGRTRRRCFVEFAFICFILFVIATVLDYFLFNDFMERFTDIPILRRFGPLLVILLVGLASPILAAITRRLHDAGMSGKWLVLLLVPVLGWIMLLVLTLRPTQPYDNNWGYYNRKPAEIDEQNNSSNYNPFAGDGERPKEESNESLFDDNEEDNNLSREGHL